MRKHLNMVLVTIAVLVVSAVAYGVTKPRVNKSFAENNIGYDCTATTEANCGAWASRATSTSTSESITVIGARVGDHCEAVLGPLPAAANQALVTQCYVTSQDTATLRITNASGGSLTPTAGQRGCACHGY